MKSIENISQQLEKVILKGLDTTNYQTHIKLFQAGISLYFIDGTMFIYYNRFNPFSKTRMVNLYEIKSTESYYLFDTIKKIIEDISNYGHEASEQDTFKIYSEVIKFCKKIGFNYKDFEIAIKELTNP